MAYKACCELLCVQCARCWGGEHLPAFRRPLVGCISVCVGCRGSLAPTLHARLRHGHPRPVGRNQRCRSQHAARVGAELVRQAPCYVTGTVRNGTAATGEELVGAAAAGARGRGGGAHPARPASCPSPAAGRGRAVRPPGHARGGGARVGQLRLQSRARACGGAHGPRRWQLLARGASREQRRGALRREGSPCRRP